MMGLEDQVQIRVRINKDMLFHFFKEQKVISLISVLRYIFILQVCVECCISIMLWVLSFRIWGPNNKTVGNSPCL